jgi:transposase
VDAVLGIDIAKTKFDVALLFPDGKVRRKSCPNTAGGFDELSGWLKRQGAPQVHAALEATGTYGDALAHYLHDAGHVVSVLNPAIIHAFAASQLARAKTAAVDATLIARYTATQQPPAWTPAPREIRELQALVRRLDALQVMRTQETNRLEAGLIAELFDKPYGSARQAAAFAGVVPRVSESGTLRTRGRMVKIGPGRLRKALYFPALTALRFNPTIRDMRIRLRAAGKPNMVIIGAAMRKLIHLAFAVLKSGRAYDAMYVHP